MSVVMYIDDGIVIAKTRQDMIKAVQIIQTDLADSGFIVNVVKSNWIPSHTISWLGFQLDSARNVFIVPPIVEEMKTASWDAFITI